MFLIFELFVQGVSLALACLSYDFVGTCLDETSEDMGHIQVFVSIPDLHGDPQFITCSFQLLEHSAQVRLVFEHAFGGMPLVLGLRGFCFGGRVSCRVVNADSERDCRPSIYSSSTSDAASLG